MKLVNSNADFTTGTKNLNKYFLFLYKGSSAVSDCAYNALKEADNKSQSGLSIFAADVNFVHDIHSFYNINSVPSLLIFENGRHINTVKGCLTSSNYTTILENAALQAKASSVGKSAKRVTVYTTPTCSWCNTLKAWLRKNNVAFSEVDVSRDQQAAADLVRRSGQQGVPQTDINGQIVVGFDQQRLKTLLELQ